MQPHPCFLTRLSSLPETQQLFFLRRFNCFLFSVYLYLFVLFLSFSALPPHPSILPSLHPSLHYFLLARPLLRKWRPDTNTPLSSLFLSLPFFSVWPCFNLSNLFFHHTFSLESPLLVLSSSVHFLVSLCHFEFSCVFFPPSFSFPVSPLYNLDHSYSF